MKADLSDLEAFLRVARAGGYRQAARATAESPSGLSEAIRRLEASLGVRLLNRTTRSVSPTEAGAELLARLSPAMAEVAAALDVVDGFRDKPRGQLKLNVPTAVSRLVLPPIIPGFLARYPEIRLEVVIEDNFVDVLAAGCDAGIRYEEKLEQDMIAVPIGPRRQRFAAAASKEYLARRGRPQHPRDLLEHDCMRVRFDSGATPSWEFERNGESILVDPSGPLIVRASGAGELCMDAAMAGTGIVYLFEDWIRPHLLAGRLEPVLEDWWPSFSGPFLYYPGRRLLPTPLRAFVDYIKEARQ